MIESKGVCYICEEKTDIIDSHHIWPEFAGGEQGPVVDLCSRCHSGIHRQALNLLSKTAKRKAYFNVKHMERAAPLVKYLVMAIQQTKEKRSPGSKSIITIETTPDFLLMLHLLKTDAGHSNLSVFCAQILREYARRKI